MASRRETILEALFAAVSAIPSVHAVRNEVTVQDLDAEPVILALMDGGPEAEQIVAGGSHEFTHVAEIDIAIADAGTPARDAEFDRVATAIDTTLAADRTLGGLADYLEVRPPQNVSPERVLGAESVKHATIPVAIWYTAASTAG